MAVFGPQLIYTVIMFVLLSKLGRFYSMGRYILCRKLYRYLSPNSEDIKKSVRNYYRSTTAKNKKLNRLFDIDDKKEEFNIPEGAEIELACSPVHETDLYYIKYTDDLQSFVDISFIALFIYITTEIYYALVVPSDEVNLSVVWCFMALTYGIMTLANIALNYIRTDEGVLLYIFAGLSFMVSLLVQLGDTKFFDFNLKDAFQNVTSNMLGLLQAHIAAINGTNQATDATTQSKEFLLRQLKTYSTNDILFTCFIAFISSFIGAILFFPSFRMARLHFLCIKNTANSKITQCLLYVNFVIPLLVSLCWLNSSAFVKKSSFNSTLNATDLSKDDEVTAQFLSAVMPIASNLTNASAIALANQSAKRFIYDIFMAQNLKIYLVVLLFVLRMALYRQYIQAYLNVALDLAWEVRQGAKRITNTRYMQTISTIYQYYGVVASQYLIPMFTLLLFSLLLKTLGDLSWCGDSVICNDIVNSVSNYTATLKSGYKTSPSLLKQFESANFNMTMSHNVMTKVFSADVLRSLIGYFTFWTSTVWFMFSCIGLIYYNYIDRQV